MIFGLWSMPLLPVVITIGDCLVLKNNICLYQGTTTDGNQNSMYFGNLQGGKVSTFYVFVIENETNPVK